MVPSAARRSGGGRWKTAGYQKWRPAKAWPEPDFR